MDALSPRVLLGVRGGVRCAGCMQCTRSGTVCGTHHVGSHSKGHEARNASACVGE